MAYRAMNAATASGSISQTIAKNKEFRFRDQMELERYLSELLDFQEGLCALTGLALGFGGVDDDPALTCSLDRIDSDGHYERGNLQIVCKFANQWKGDTDNAEFLRLLDKVVSSGG
jgi:hypothetical protein